MTDFTVILALVALIALVEYQTARYRRRKRAQMRLRRVLEWDAADFWPGNWGKR